MKRKRPYPLTDDEICMLLVRLFTGGLPVVDNGTRGRSTSALFGRSLSKALQFAGVMRLGYALPVGTGTNAVVRHPNALAEFLEKRCTEQGTPGVQYHDRHYIRRVIDLIEMAQVRVGLGDQGTQNRSLGTLL